LVARSLLYQSELNITQNIFMDNKLSNPLKPDEI
jgi:hypothetical protein